MYDRTIGQSPAERLLSPPSPTTKTLLRGFTTADFYPISTLAYRTAPGIRPHQVATLQRRSTLGAALGSATSPTPGPSRRAALSNTTSTTRRQPPATPRSREPPVTSDDEVRRRIEESVHGYSTDWTVGSLGRCPPTRLAQGSGR